MKKIISILLVLSVLCSLPLFASAEQDDEFVFRNGIKWGMSEAEIMELEERGNVFGDSANDTELPDGNSIRSLYLNMVPYGDVAYSTLIYHLYEDSLCFAGYDIDDGIDVDATIKEFTGVYGDEASVTPLSKAELFALLFGYDMGGLTAKELMNDPRYNAIADTIHYWTLPDGTEIFLAVDSLTWERPTSYVFYWNQTFRTLMEGINAETAADRTLLPQPTPSPRLASDGEFVFRNGIKWGMSEAEVIELEGRGNVFGDFADDTELPDGNSFRSLYLNMVPYGDVAYSTLIYYLYEDSLCFAGYDIDDGIDVDATIKELTGEYGEEATITEKMKAELISFLFGYDTDDQAIKELMNDPGYNAVAETIHYWTLPDGTEIFLGVNSLEKFPSVFLCYWNWAYGVNPLDLISTYGSVSTPSPQPTASPQPASDNVTVMYSDGREVSYSRDEMRSALGGNMVLLRNSCMDGITDCDMTPVYEAMDFAVLKGAVKIKTPLTQEQFDAANSWRNLEMTDAVPGVNPEAYAWDQFYKILFPTLEMFTIYDNFDGTYTIQFGFNGGRGTTNEGIAEAIAKGREEALRIVNSIPSFCNTGNHAEFNRLEYLYDYITHYVRYYDNSEWEQAYYDDKDHIHLLYDALISKETVCAGFAYSFAYLCELAGIDAQFAVMESYESYFNNDVDTTHAVVIAKEHVSYHWFDPTWDAGMDQVKDGFKYFGISEGMMFHNHKYSRTLYPRGLYPECPGGLTRGRTGYWDFDTGTYYSF